MLSSLIDGIGKFFTDLKFWVTILPWQKGVRVRAGRYVKVLPPGLYFKVPFIDQVYFVFLRLRTLTTPKQDLTTVDGKNVTITIHVAYEIEDPLILMQTLYRPGQTIADLAQAAAASYISKIKIVDLNIPDLEEQITTKLNLEQYGLKCLRCYIGNYVLTRAYRIIGDTEGAGIWDTVANKDQNAPDD